MSVCIRVSGVCVVYTWRSEGNSRESVRLPPCQFRGSNPGRHAWLQAPVPAQPPLRQLLISPSSPVSPRPAGHLPARCEPALGAAGEGGARPARPSRGPVDAAGRSVIRGACKAPEGQVSSASGGRRGGATRGSPGPVGCAGNKSRARASEPPPLRCGGRRRGAPAAPPPTRGPGLPHVPSTPPRGSRARGGRSGTASTGLTPGSASARAPHPRGHGARTCRRRRLRRRRVPPPRAPLSPPSRPPLRPHAQSLSRAPDTTAGDWQRPQAG